MADNYSKTSTFDLVQAFYDRIWNGGDTAAAVDLLTENFIFRGSLGSEMSGRVAFCDYVRLVRSGLKEYRCTILDCVTEGSKAFAKMRFSGVHLGQFMGYAPTGKSVQWLGAALFRIDGPLIADLWVLGDLVSLQAILASNAAPG